ncbi:hypothetical protein LP416_26325 [Polaromonas sp. P2-4]|nr:hypothetical protein LP416_26325 [Polaromonas sp. P2-4]
MKSPADPEPGHGEQGCEHAACTGALGCGQPERGEAGGERDQLRRPDITVVELDQAPIGPG